MAGLCRLLAGKILPAPALFFLCLLVSQAIAFARPPGETAKETAIPLTAHELQWLRDHPVIRVAPDRDFPPIEFIDQDGRFKGIAADFIRLLEKRLPIKFEIVDLANWDAVLAAARSRQIDMLSAATPTPARLQYLRFTRPFVEFPAVVLVRDTMMIPPAKSVADLKGMRVAVVSNYAAHDYMRDYHPEIELAVMPSITTGLRQVSFDKVDAMIVNLASATYYIEKEGITNLKVHTDTGLIYRLAFAGRSDWPELNTILQKGVASFTMAESKEIITPWVGLREEPWRPSRKLIISVAMVLGVAAIFAILLWNNILRRQVTQKTAKLQKELAGRERTEKKLKESEQRLYLALKAAHQGLYDLNVTTGDAVVNAEYALMLGHDPDGFVETNRKWIERLHPGDREKTAAYYKAYVRGETDIYRVEFRQRTKSGDWKWILSLGKIVEWDEEGNPARMLGTHTDITERKRMEEELTKAHKLESVGVLAGGIAHDFNNLLAGILGNVSLAKDQMPPEDPLFPLLEATENCSRQARGLTQQLLTFAKGGAPVTKTVSVKGVIEDSAQLALRGTNSKWEFSIPDDLWCAEIDEGQISQVIRNLVVNADQAMPEGGTVSVRAANTVVDEHQGLPLANGKYVRISVQDQGKGIPQEILSRIFDPYFTTKEDGSGLGLAICYSIVKKHHGLLTVEPECNAGATFHVLLPAAEKTLPPQEEAKTEAEAVIPGRGAILVMDDEAPVRGVTARMLDHIGYRADFAADGLEAVARFTKAREAGQPYDAVILDLTIPGGMGGREVIGKLLEIDPEVRAIVSSGYANDPVMADFRQYGFSGVVAKPFSVTKLSRVLHEVVNMGR